MMLRSIWYNSLQSSTSKPVDQLRSQSFIKGSIGILKKKYIFLFKMIAGLLWEKLYALVKRLVWDVSHGEH